MGESNQLANFPICEPFLLAQLQKFCTAPTRLCFRSCPMTAAAARHANLAARQEELFVQPAGMPAAPTESARERLSEIAEILAAGLMRLHARKSSELSAH